jgi:hypothetical protein
MTAAAAAGTGLWHSAATSSSNAGMQRRLVCWRRETCTRGQGNAAGCWLRMHEHCSYENPADHLHGRTTTGPNPNTRLQRLRRRLRKRRCDRRPEREAAAALQQLAQQVAIGVPRCAELVQQRGAAGPPAFPPILQQLGVVVGAAAWEGPGRAQGQRAQRRHVQQRSAVQAPPARGVSC